MSDVLDRRTQEHKEQLAEALTGTGRVRALGSRHSFNDVADTDGVHVQVDALDDGRPAVDVLDADGVQARSTDEHARAVARSGAQPDADGEATVAVGVELGDRLVRDGPQRARQPVSGEGLGELEAPCEAVVERHGDGRVARRCRHVELERHVAVRLDPGGLLDQVDDARVRRVDGVLRHSGVLGAAESGDRGRDDEGDGDQGAARGRATGSGTGAGHVVGSTSSRRTARPSGRSVNPSRR